MTYDTDNRLSSLTRGNRKLSYVYDDYGRLSTVTRSNNGGAFLETHQKERYIKKIYDKGASQTAKPPDWHLKRAG